LLSWIKESRRCFPAYHEFLDRMLWLAILPSAFGAIIAFMFSIEVGLMCPSTAGKGVVRRGMILEKWGRL